MPLEKKWRNTSLFQFLKHNSNMKNIIRVALIGNPNTGKTSLFNTLTGLNQQVGNYPGITVERKVGMCKLNNTTEAKIIDLPGTYSLQASSPDEKVVVSLLTNKEDKDFPDVVVVVCEPENIKRNLLLFTQIKELKLPTILVINMADTLDKKGISLDIPYLEKNLFTKVVLTSSRNNTGVKEVKEAILDFKTLSLETGFTISQIDNTYFNELPQQKEDISLYENWLTFAEKTIEENNLAQLNQVKKWQHKETFKRYQYIENVLKSAKKVNPSSATDWRSKLDRIFLHPVLGYVIFFILLAILFQTLYEWSSLPMDLIDTGFANLSDWVKNTLPEGKLNDLITDGLIPGIGGVVIFIPQIAFLFLFISLLEESGYMSRVVFLMDKSFRKFGLNGKSIVPLISGTACAIPAVMATRNIENWKDRLITLLVTPFATCSARIPVYTLLIALVIPDKKWLGVFNYQGLVLLGLYALGFLAAILSAKVLQKVIKSTHKSYFIIEMPSYKVPYYKNVGITVIEKTKAFVFGAGKIIISISIILWFLANYGPNTKIEDAQKTTIETYGDLNETDLQDKLEATKLENSYIGILGKTIEPLIAPLGYDWKIGIGIIGSFAAREVFVGTMATIYSIGSHQEEVSTIKTMMQKETNSITKKPIYNLATGVSLLLFYAFAMQCMSTIAIVKKETNSWKWPLIQFLFMTGLAYITAFFAHSVLQ